MIQEIDSEKLPIKMWLNDLGKEAMEQARNLANFPYAFHHVAIMPDAHLGYGMPVGGVLATRDVVVPNAVGKDIGCGMCAVQTSLQEITTTDLKRLLGSPTEGRGIRGLIPVGFKHHKEPQDETLMPDTTAIEAIDGGRAKQLCASALKQLGTLGSGNHFIEIQRGSDGHIWLMIHSGSRNLGLKVAEHYDNLAIAMHERQQSSVPKHHKLAWLPLESSEAQNYLTEMQFCVEFAHANRMAMMLRVQQALQEVMQETAGTVKFAAPINIAHNYAVREKHFDEEVIVHRKGATRASAGEQGIIPGSQGAHSYIVQGKGNAESFSSCSHGAGRTMGRIEARRTLNLEQERQRLNQMGVIHGLRTGKELDEAPGAYKDIATVMKNQRDLVDILVELTPLAVVKG